MNTSLLKQQSGQLVPPTRSESTASAAAHHTSEEEEEDQYFVSDNDDDELEFRGQSSSYQASSILRRPGMFSLRAESSIDSEDYSTVFA